MNCPKCGSDRFQTKMTQDESCESYYKCPDCGYLTVDLVNEITTNKKDENETNTC